MGTSPELMPKSPDAFRTISEVADWLGLQAHVLRFWESKFTHVKPVKRAGGRRYYRPADMLLLGGIKKLLHDDGLTIKGVQKILREKGVSHVADQSQALDDLTMAVIESNNSGATGDAQDAAILEALTELEVTADESDALDEGVTETLGLQDDLVVSDAVPAATEPETSETTETGQSLEDVANASAMSDGVDGTTEVVEVPETPAVVPEATEVPVEADLAPVATDAADASTESSEVEAQVQAAEVEPEGPVKAADEAVATDVVQEATEIAQPVETTLVAPEAAAIPAEPDVETVAAEPVEDAPEATEAVGPIEAAPSDEPAMGAELTTEPDTQAQATLDIDEPAPIDPVIDSENETPPADAEAEPQPDAIPSFVRRPRSVPVPEPVTEASATSDAPASGPIEAEAPDEMRSADTVDSIEAEPPQEDVLETAAEDADPSIEEAVAPKPLVVDVALPPAEADIPAKPSALSAVTGMKKLGPGEQDAIKPLLAQLIRLRASMASPRKDVHKD